MIVDNPNLFLQSNQWLEQIGCFYISFIENTIGGAKERRILFDDALDVDFVILSKGNFENAVKNGGIDILKRGYRILVDKIDLEHTLTTFSIGNLPYSLLSEHEFINIVNDFWYHTIWTAKKIMRGELWAEDWIIQKLSNCYAHYEKNDIKIALSSTMELFRLVAVEVAGKLNYKYPTKADEYSTEWIKKSL